jgi:hypothetical protein
MKEKKQYIHVESEQSTINALEASVILEGKRTGYKVTKKSYLKKLIESEYERLQAQTEGTETA